MRAKRVMFKIYYSIKRVVPCCDLYSVAILHIAESVLRLNQLCLHSILSPRNAAPNIVSSVPGAYQISLLRSSLLKSQPSLISNILAVLKSPSGYGHSGRYPLKSLCFSIRTAALLCHGWIGQHHLLKF